VANPDEPIECRAAVADDRSDVLALLQATMEWPDTDAYAAFFDWKHATNAFGPSPMWVATCGRRIVGLRVFLRWEFEHGARCLRAVRAVDTATHPDFQGRGIFTRLTLAALDGLALDGVDFVFNTPNDKSGPGYLKMGWREVGRLPVRIRPRTPAVLARVARTRVPAERFGQPVDIGVPPAEALRDTAAIERLLARSAPSAKVRTRRSVEFLRWRYAGLPELGYRALLAGSTVDDGVVFFRVRRRGDALEAGINDVLVPNGDARVARDLQRAVLRQTNADYTLRLAAATGAAPLELPLPRQGPRLFCRSVVSDAPLALHDFEVGLGDMEMF
jgi:hypothetical protein